MTRVLTPEARALERIHARIAAACARAGRDADEVLLIGAGKTVPAEKVGKFLQAGLQAVGENYVQEGIAKIEVLRPQFPNATFHFIGALQSNKACEAVEYFDAIHSVDRPSLVAALDKAARAIGKAQNVLLQVNLGGELSKAGCAPDDVSALAAQIAQRENLKLCGLMCLPPFHEDPAAMRPYFRVLRELRDALPGEASALHLSMGMSNDFEIAIEEGATMIRVGTALFGSRKIEEKLNEKTN
jgi:pyridoxal phosphate enzyme (YggS family)